MKVPSLKQFAATELTSRLNSDNTDDLKKLLTTTIGNQYLVEKHSKLSKLALLRADSIENEHYYRELLLEKDVITDNQQSRDSKSNYKREYIEKELTKLLLNESDCKEEVESSREFVFELNLHQVSNLDRINSFLPSFVNLSSLTLQIQHASKVELASTLAELVRSIGSLSNLLSFALINSQINDDLLRPFVKQLEKTTINERLIELDLSYNKISTEGFRLVLAYFLDRQDTILTQLNFAGNEIQAEGGRMLGRIIKDNTSLVVIDLRMNLFGDEGGKMIIEALKKNNSLQYLNLSHNDLSSGSADVVCKLLETCKERNSKLDNLSLCGNAFTNSDLKHMEVSARSEGMNIIDTRGNDEKV
ncbi:hypothetical protein CTEN210_09915 [Chaetoceros tenuissimus]|uniref:Uncharacterized protein n=1 Tax=Chaetoceros tenuissimus TaxID=426638 RepID=A0AAD3CX16_9STRA|nr:hypothetical protein CTEN210_09915 [Chaetoceros tenuissimus]